MARGPTRAPGRQCVPMSLGTPMTATSASIAFQSTQAGDLAKVQCPTLFVLGQHDQMTPPKAAQSLIRKAQHGQVVQLQAGHSLMTEAPDAVLHALVEFLKP